MPGTSLRSLPRSTRRRHQPLPRSSPRSTSPRPEPITDAEPQPFTEAQPAEAPRIEPWSPDSDPWGAAWTMPPAVDEATVEDAAADEHADEAPPVEEAGVEDELDAGVVSAESPTDGWQAAEPEPDLEPEPPLTTDDSHDDEPDLAAAAIAGMAVEGATDETPALAEDDSPEDEQSIAGCGPRGRRRRGGRGRNG